MLHILRVHLSVDHEFLSLVAHTQTSLFKNASFEASNDNFQETPLLKKGKGNIYWFHLFYN